MKKAVFAVLDRLVYRFVENAANVTWDQFWFNVFEAVEEVEKYWQNGYGKKKKEYVINYVIDKLEFKGLPGKIKQYVVRAFLEIVLDSLIDTINKELGQDWIVTAKQHEKKLADRFDIIH
jgi:hypothetical protein